MKVKTLIQYLEKKNPEARVMLNYKDGNECLFCVSEVGKDDVVWLEGEKDIDLEKELKARFENALETGMDELDFYMDLLEIGITPEMILVHCKDMPSAFCMESHMRKFCKEHGLI